LVVSFLLFVENGSYRAILLPRLWKFLATREKNNLKPDGPVLRAIDYEVRDVPLSVCQELVARYHYARGGSNTATFKHGLFKKNEEPCLGVAWWIPPTKSAALATWPENWRGVLALSRLVIVPDVPKNAATFLLGQSVKRIRREARWECLVTYADQWQGHTGGIYKASNWEYVGLTQPEACFVDASGRMTARKAGPKTRTRQEMQDLGCAMIGKFSKHKFRLVLKKPVKDFLADI
jgi:hypothetical protein